MDPSNDQTSSSSTPATNFTRITISSLLHPTSHSSPSVAISRLNFPPALNNFNTSNPHSNSFNPSVGIHSTSLYPSINVESGRTAAMNNTQITTEPGVTLQVDITTTRTTTTDNPSSTHPATTQRETSRLLTEEIKQTVREEIERMTNELIKQEVEKEIENKIGSKKISTSRRSRVYKKVTAELQKQMQETIEKIVEDQLDTTSSSVESTENSPITEDRVEDEIAARLRETIRSLLSRSMEKAIADEMIEQVKIEKLTRTPTIIPEFQVPSRFGVRHTQTFMVLLFLLISYWQRVDFNTGIVAMNDSSRSNPDFVEFEWGETKIAVLLSSFYCGYFVLQIPGGILAEKYGPKLVMTISMMACSFLALLIPVTALVGGWVGLFVMKFLQGAVQGVFIPTVYIFTSRWIPPKEKSKLFTPAFGGMQLGIVFGMPVTGILCDSFLGWPSAFFFSSCIGFFWVATWVILAANSPSVHRSISREEKLYIEGSFGFGEITLKGAEKIIPWKSIMKCIPFWALVICHFGQNWALTILITEMPVYNNHVLKLKIAENASWSALCYLVGWIFIIIFGFLATVLENKNWISLSKQRKAWNSISALGGTACFLIFCYCRTKNKYLAIVLFTVALATNSGCYNGLFSNHADLSPNYIGILMGLSNMVGNVASMLAPVFVGYAVNNWDDLDQWSTVFITSAIILFSTNLIFILFGSSDIQPWNTPSDLHLHLEDVDTAAAARMFHRRRRGRGQTYVVTNTNRNEVLDQDDEIRSPLPSKQHRKSI